MRHSATRLTFTFYLIVTAFLLLSQPSASGGSPGQVPWGFTLEGPPYAILGQNISLEIWGPENGSVNVTFYTQPFLKVPPSEVYQFNFTTQSQIQNNTTRGPVNTTVAVFENISVSTSFLYAGSVMLCVDTDLLTPEGCPVIALSDSNFSTVEEQIAEANFNYTLASDRQYSETNIVTTLNNNLSLFYGVSFAMWGTLFVAIVFTRTRVSNMQIGRVLAETVRRTFLKDRHEVFHTGRRPNPEPMSDPNPDRVCRSKLFPSCLQCTTQDHTPQEMKDHLLHKHGFANARENRDFYRRRSSVKAAVSRRNADEPSTAAIQRHIAATNLDLSHLASADPPKRRLFGGS